MPNWKKVIVSGSAAEITTLKTTGLTGQSTENTSLMINSSGVVGTRELGSNAFNSNTIRSYTAGGGLTLTGTVFSHTDTSARSSENGSGRTYIQDITLDTYGHVTGITTSAETVVNTDTQLSDAQVRSKHTGGTNVSINSSGVISSTDTNTQLNSTQVRSNFTGGTNVSINSSGVITSTDTNTTYSVGDGGLTQKNFTTALKAKLDAIPTLTSNTDVDTGIETVMSVDDASIGVFFDYVVSNGTNLRAGTITSVHDGTNVEYAETSTADLGDTNDLTLSVDISAGNVRLRATAKSNNWSVKVLARLI